jgi:hypothetical protein
VRKSSVFSSVPQKRFSAIGANWVVFFGAGAPVVSQRLFPAEPHLVPREFGRKGVVFYDKIGAGAPVVSQRLFSFGASRGP